MIYSAYKLDTQSRRLLKSKFPHKYKSGVTRHVTHTFGKHVPLAPNAKVEVTGHCDSGDGLEAFTVTVNGEAVRPDGGLFHITHSLIPGKYAAKDSNTLLKKGNITKIDPPIPISVEPYHHTSSVREQIDVALSN